MRLLVDTPTSAQELIEVGLGGGYFDASRVLWDEREHGPIPNITLGGMVRVGEALVYDANRMAQHVAAIRPVPQRVPRLNARLAMIAEDLWGDITEFVIGMNDPVALAFFEDAQTWARDNPLVAAWATARGKSSAEVDDLFIKAAQIAV